MVCQVHKDRDRAELTFLQFLSPYPDNSAVLPEHSLPGLAVYHTTEGHGLFSKCEVCRWSLKNHENVRDCNQWMKADSSSTELLASFWVLQAEEISAGTAPDLAGPLLESVREPEKRKKSYSLCNSNQTHIFLSRAILSHSLLSFFSPKQSPFEPIWGC